MRDKAGYPDDGGHSRSRASGGGSVGDRGLREMGVVKQMETEP